MPILIFAENTDGGFKKNTLELATYAYDLASQRGDSVAAVSIGPTESGELEKLAQYGVSKVYEVKGDSFTSFANNAYAAVISSVATEIDANIVLLSQTYNGRAILPRVAAKLDAAPLSGVITLPEGEAMSSQRFAYSGKGVEMIKANKEKVILSLKTNSYKVAENPVAGEIIAYNFNGSIGVNEIAKEILKATEGVSLQEADVVVSAGRGMKGPENWGMIEELAGLLGAATACSKPTADMGWRPHHEHVGQTGIQIAPNLYIAIGISGAIQHLAGVSSSKYIVVINKDPEAPFFKIADYGIVGDLFDVVPELIKAVKSHQVALS